jgi:tetratricopeptide (TPR) repeat protein
LVKDFPAVPDYREALAGALGNLAISFQRKGRAEEAESFLKSAVAESRKLVAQFPAVPGFRQGLAINEDNLGTWLTRRSSFPEAEAAYQRGLEERRKLAAESPRLPRYQLELAESYFNLGILYRKMRRLSDAEAAQDQALTLRERLVQEAPTVAEYQRALTTSYSERWGLMIELGRKEDARAAYEEILKRNPGNPVIHNYIAWTLATSTYAQFRDPGRAVQLAKRAVELAPQEGGFRNTLGVAHYRAGEWQAAVAALNQSMELRKGGDSSDWFFLAMAHWQLGDKEQARTCYDKAVQWMDKNKPQDEELRRFRTEAAALLAIKDAPAPREESPRKP